MSTIQEILNKKLSVDTDTSSQKSNLNSTDTSLSVDNAGYWNDHYADHVLSDLVNPQYRKWYCGAFYKLGKARVDALAAQARKGNHPQRYFSALIKGALNA